MDNTTMKTRLAEFLHTAQTEIDALHVQLALGKMEAGDLFEQTKKDLDTRLSELKAAAEKSGTANSEKLKTAIDDLRVQLSYGKAVALDAFYDQKEKIHQSAERLEHEIRNGNYGLSSETNLKLRNEIYKFRLKADLLKIRYELGKMELKEKVADKKDEIRKDIDEMLSHIPEIKESISDSIEEAGEGLKKAYGKMMKRFS